MALIVEEMASANRSNVDVVVTIVVVVTYDAAEAVHFDRDTGLGSHIGEGAVMVVVIERRVRLAGFVRGPVHRVDEQDVGPTVIVIVDHADTRAHGFGQKLLSVCTAVVLEVDAGLGG